jgi:hypothetical protein
MTNEYNGYLETQYLFNEQIIIGNEQNETEYSSLSLNYINSEKNIDQFCNFDLNMNIDEAYTKIFKPTESKEKKEKIFDVVLREREREIKSLFTNIENEESNSNINDENFLKRKRYPQKRRRRENQDNMRKKIKRGFLNNSLIQKINELLKGSGSILYFEKFPQNFVCNISRQINNKLINMTLKEIFETKELYDEKELNNYYHNLKVVKSEEIKEYDGLKIILNKKYCELFEEYINSKEFQIDEINRLKNKEMNDAYIERYIYLAKHFIDFFNNL